jgi:hypothetical protein
MRRCREERADGVRATRAARWDEPPCEKWRERRRKQTLTEEDWAKKSAEDVVEQRPHEQTRASDIVEEKTSDKRAHTLPLKKSHKKKKTKKNDLFLC